MTGAELRDVFGGRWDGGGREVHGLIERDGRRLKIELLHTSDWACAIFEAGRCVASGSDSDAISAVRHTLAVLEG